MKLTRLYTRTGDKGDTTLVGGVKIRKSHPRIEAYGTIDELNSQLGLLASMMPDGSDKLAIERAQSTLFSIGTYLATDTAQTPIPPSAHLSADAVSQLEQSIDEAVAQTPPLDAFVLPGGCPAAAQAHVCRAVCRRAERRMVELADIAEMQPQYAEYVNRLSDFLYALARKINYIGGVSEKKWQNSCK